MSTESDFDQFMQDAIDAYLASGEEESKGEPLPLTPDSLSEDVKEAIGLDIFPDDIQRDVLALSQKLVEYACLLAQEGALKEESKETFGWRDHAGSMPTLGGMRVPPLEDRLRNMTPSPSIQKIIKCVRSIPLGSIYRDMPTQLATVGGASVGLLGKSGPLGATLALGTYAAHYGGAILGHTIGCIINSPNWSVKSPAGPSVRPPSYRR